MKARFPLLGPLVLGIALAGYLRSGFALDDFIHLERVVRQGGRAALDYAVRTDELGLRLWWLGDPVAFGFLRPLVLALLDLEAALFGTRALPFHGVSLALHVLNVLLCRAIGRRVGLSARGAAWAAVGWGVSIHAPIAVGWVSGQSELLVASLVLASVLALLRARLSASPGWLAASLAAFALALLAKESAVVTPLLMLAAYRMARDSGTLPAPGTRRVAWFAPALAGVLVLYLAARVTLDPPAPPVPYLQPVQSVAGLGHLVARALHYMGGAALGVPVLPLTIGGVSPALQAVAVLAGLLGGVVLVRLARAGWRGGLLWFGAALAPYALVMATSLYLYLPMCGVSWMIAGAVQRKSRFARALAVWLIASGAVGHVLAGAWLHRVTASIDAATDALVATGHRDVVLVDAPFWWYSLPSAVRLASPGRDLRLHVVNVAPGSGARASRVEWMSDDELVVTNAAGFFRSPVERFFLFGATPCRRDAPGGTIRVSCAGGDPPTALRVRLRDGPVAARPAVFRYDGAMRREIRP